MENNEQEKSSFKSEVIDFIKTFLICLVSIWVLTTFFFTPVRVDGDSMYPTLHDEDMGFSNVFSANFFDVERFDVVVVNAPEENSKDHWVKRVIGLPNETIECIDDVIYIDGEPIEEPFLDEAYRQSQIDIYGYFTYDFGPYTLGEDEYFVLGDNRTNSTDSRVVGPFTRDHITSKGVFVYFPFNHFSFN